MLHWNSCCSLLQRPAFLPCKLLTRPCLRRFNKARTYDNELCWYQKIRNENRTKKIVKRKIKCKVKIALQALSLFLSQFFQNMHVKLNKCGNSLNGWSRAIVMNEFLDIQIWILHSCNYICAPEQQQNW